MHTSTKFSQFFQGNNVVAGDLVAGLRNGQNTLFNASSLAIIPWSILLVGQPLLIDQGYFIQNGIPQNFALPTIAPFGHILQIINSGGVNFTITQAIGQSIQFGDRATTPGVGGSITSTQEGDGITLICNAENTSFTLLGAPLGNWDVV
jgi:hypothetical protein